MEKEVMASSCPLSPPLVKPRKMLYYRYMANLRALPDAVLARFREWGRQGGIARKNKLSPKRRKEIATIAVRARESRKASRREK